MVRVLHLSDLHLNTGFGSKKQSVRESLKEALLNAFEKSVHYAVANRLDAIIIAGDLFDNDNINFHMEKRILKNIQSILDSDIDIFYSTGNHDPMGTTNILNAYKSHPRLHIFESDEIVRKSMQSKDGTSYEVVGCGHKSKGEKRNLIKKFPFKNNRLPWIGIAHASVPSARTVSEKESYMPTALSDIESLDYDYFALGHIHIRQKLTQKVAYSGNIQGLSIKETGNKGGYLVELDMSSTNVTPVDFHEIEWVYTELEITPETTNFESLSILMTRSIMEKVAINEKSYICRVALKGRSSLYKELKESSNIRFLEEDLCNELGVLDLEIKTDAVTRNIDIEELKREATVLSYALRQLEFCSESEALMERLYALPIFPRGMTENEKKKLIITKYEKVQNEIVNRMVRNDYDY
ncbi:MAG: DNA repair exonuclease [Clostridia bacterium]|nr:DNA repair exonuclease [Clostridia bacterium]